MHPLVADGGEMTVLRDLAAFSYGRWSVDWPESVPEEQRPELPDDRDFGYASKLKQDPGRFGRRFVRADVSITAQDFDEAGKPIPFSGESDAEQVLDDASSRTDGDVFFEREITRAGLGALQPRVDFDVDSVVPVLIWGKTIAAPVTSIEDVVEAGAVVDYRVHVGGQLLQDDAARERANREVERTIAQERRERVKAVSKAQSTADSAKGTADSAMSTADEAKKTADETAALVDGLDIEGSIQKARDAVDSSNAILQLVRQLTGAAAAQGAQAQASASLAIEYANRAEDVLDKLDPLRDDVVAAHAEVARLSGEAAKAAQAAAAAVAEGEQYAVNAEKSMIDAAGHVARAKQFASAAGAAADEGAEHVESGRKQVDQASSAASSAQQSAEKSQRIVDEAQVVLDGVRSDAAAAKKALTDAGELLADVDGSGRSLGDVLAEVARLHQETLSRHDEILAAHGDVLELHGTAIKYAAMAAAQAAMAAQSASLAAEEALQAAGKALDAEAANRAADAARGDALEALGKAQAETGKAAQSALQAASHNAESAQKLAEADEKLIEADRKLQEQIDVLEESQRLLAQAIRYVAAAAAQAAQAAMSAAQASEENANALAQTNIAVDAANDSIEALKETNKARDEVVGNIQKSVDSVTKAQKAQSAAEAARDQTLKDVSLQTWVANFRRVRQAMYTSDSWYVDSEGQFDDELRWNNGVPLAKIRVVKESGNTTLYVKKVGQWAGDIEITGMTTASDFGGLTNSWGFSDTSERALYFKTKTWQRIFVKVYPEWPDAETRDAFNSLATKYRPLM